MKEINELINDLDDVLRTKNLNNYSKLSPPLPEKDMEDILRALRIDNRDFKLLYQWKNGFDPGGKVIGSCQIFRLDTLLPLRWILEKRMINQSDPIWNDSFIPLITDSTGQFYLFNNKAGKNYGKIHLYSVSLFFIEEPISCYDSIASMLETTIEAYNEGSLKYDSDEDWLNVDVKKYKQLAKRINKNSDYWSRAK